MKIKTKLQMGFTLLLLILVSTTVFGYIRLSSMDQLLSSIYDNQFHKVHIIVDVRDHVTDSNRLITDIVFGITDQQSGIEQITSKLAEATKQFQLLSETPSTAMEQQFIDKIKSDAEQYSTYLRTLARLMEEGQQAKIKQLYIDQGREATNNILRALNELIDYEQQTLEDEVAKKKAMYRDTVRISAALTVLGILLGIFVLLWVVPGITAGLNQLNRMAAYFSRGKLKRFARMNIEPKDELGELARLFRTIAMDLQAKNEREAEMNAILHAKSRKDAQLARATELLLPSNDMNAAASSFIQEFAPVLGAEYGAVYLADPHSGDHRLLPAGTYAGSAERLTDLPEQAILKGEGLVGQCARRGAPIVINDVPEGYVTIASGIGRTHPEQLMLYPVSFDDELLGVIELAAIRPFTADNRELLDSLSSQLGMLVHNIRSRLRVEELLRESRVQSEELQTQSVELVAQREALRQTNDELEKQRNALKSSQNRLQRQQEELELANQELIAKKFALEEHIRRTEQQNRQIAQANAELEHQALQLAITSKYRSEFLANMSHELRTPLNSLLVLAEFLIENKEGNLNAEQQEYVNTIHASGTDLLKMIDEILDLSKIDAGKMELHPEWTAIGDIAAYFESTYTPMAQRKGLGITVNIADGVPQAIWTDGHRLKQILRNLFSNAMKFTHRGSVNLLVDAPTAEELASLAEPGDEAFIAFRVADTGIGIAPDKHDQVFEAFRQADGTTSRKYGGTGLGLTISRELARLLGGWITLQTEPGQGSTFTLIVPIHFPGTEEEQGVDEAAAADEILQEGETNSEPQAPGMQASQPFADEPSLTPEEPFAGKEVLLVDDDIRNIFALSSVLEHCLMHVHYAENGKDALRKLEANPGIDIVLMDIMMPEMNGYEAIGKIRDNPAWESLPIIALTAKAMGDDRAKCIEAGASDYIAKPVQTDQLLSLMKVWLYR